MRVTVVLIPDQDFGGYVAYVPVIPGCVTQGETIADALAMAQDAAAGMLSLAIEHDEYVPIEPPGAVIANVAIDISIPAEAVAEPAVAAG